MNNIITDATDGFVEFLLAQPCETDVSLCSGIVIFQAPGSLITRNTIWSKSRVLLGGINAVDCRSFRTPRAPRAAELSLRLADEPFDGAFTGTVVEKNLIFADTAMIKVGMGLGTMTWG